MKFVGEPGAVAISEADANESADEPGLRTFRTPCSGDEGLLSSGSLIWKTDVSPPPELRRGWGDRIARSVLGLMTIGCGLFGGD